eukprot:2704452-Rhodomonas_salina.3
MDKDEISSEHRNSYPGTRVPGLWYPGVAPVQVDAAGIVSVLLLVKAPWKWLPGYQSRFGTE